MTRAPRWRVAWRILRVLLHLAVGVAYALVVTLSLSRLRPEPLARRWMRGLLGILDVRVETAGEPASGPCLIAANHVSWLDIPVIGSQRDARFIAKREVRDWPLIGWLAGMAGTFFIRRGAGGTRPLMERMQPYLDPGGDPGGAVVLFPEGTTTDGRGLRSFHSRMFEAALVAGCPVQPVMLRYADAPDGTAVAPFIGDDDFVSHLLRVLRAPGLRVQVRYLAPIHGAPDRDTLAQGCEAAVRTALQSADPLQAWPDESSQPLRPGRSAA